MTETIDETSSNKDNHIISTPSLPLTREQLYKLVWSEPMIKVAARYGVSSSYMARVCALLNVPRPGRGYWARLKVGQNFPKSPLSDPQPGDEMMWSRNGEHVIVPRQLPVPPTKMKKHRSKPKGVRTKLHGMLDGVKEIFEEGRLSHEGGYLKPTKKKLVDLIVTKAGLINAITFANDLFWQLEDYGYHVILEPLGENFYRTAVDEHEVLSRNYGYNNLWSPGRCTVVYIGTVAIGLTIMEISEKVEARYVNGEFIREQDYIPPKRARYASDYSWTTKKDFPTGRLHLQAYSPYPNTRWVKFWQEKENGDLSKKINGIINELEQAAIIIPDRVEEAERKLKLRREQWEAEREERRKEEEKRRVAEAFKESRKELLKIIDCWSESNRIEQFLKDIQMRSADLDDMEKKILIERLKLARDLIGSVDALDHFKGWRSPDER